MNTKTLGSALLMASVTLALTGCEKKQVKTPDSVQTEDPIKEAVRRPDAPRSFPHESGGEPWPEAEALVVKALGVEGVGGHTYVSFGEGVENASELDYLRAEEGGVAACKDAQVSSGSAFVVRMKGRPASVSLSGVRFEYSYEAGELTRTRQALTVEVEGAATQEGLEERFFKCASEMYMGRRWRALPAYNMYASSRLGALAMGAEEAARAAAQVRTERFGARRPGNLEAMMDLYTGMSSVEEALQTERALVWERGAGETRDVPIGSVEGVGVAAHPWGEMINELGRESVHAPMAEVVPFDMAYVHFHDVRDFVRTARRFEEVVLPAAAALEGGEGSANVSARYERELIMRRTSISEAMGDVAVKNFAIVTSDPFLREGGDVSLLFEVNNEVALTTTLAKFVAEAKAERADLTESSFEVGGLKGTLWSTPDGAHRRHMLRVGGVLVVSNSMAAVGRIVETAAGTHDALITRGDFRYMRALYPFGEEGEDGFVFIGDDFVREAISPRTKILSSRRVRARQDLMAVNSAALLHGWLEGAPPRSLDEMKASGALAPGVTETFEGEPITFTLGGGARSARWGTVSMPTPLIEVSIKAATREEAEAYGAFNEGYQEYWRQFIDPIGVRLNWSEEGALEVDARMLPLIEGTSYDELIELVGRKRFMLDRAPVAGVSFFYGLGEDVSLRRDLSSFVDEMIDNEDVSIDWAGDWVGFGFGDRSGLWDVMAATGQIPMEGKDHDINGWDGLFYALARLPMWAMVEVEDEVTLRRAIGALSAELSQSDDFLTWTGGAPYREVETGVILESPKSGRMNDPGMAFIPLLDLHYAIAGGVLVLALERELLEEKIDDALDGRVPRASSKGVEALPNLEDSGTQVTMTVRPWPEDSDLVDTIAGLMESSTMAGASASAVMLRVLTEGLGAEALGTPEAIDAAALTYFGVTPYAPHGVGWTVRPGGEVSHGSYGAWAGERVLELPVKGSPVTALLESLVGLDMSLGFDGDGTHRGLHTRLRWRAR